MSRRCKPAFKEKWNSANHAHVICGRRCWTSIRAAEARGTAPRRLSALSCVWQGKLLIPKSAHAVLANVDRPDQVASLARMVAMEHPARTETREARAKTPERKRKFCLSHLNASARRNPVHLDPLARREAMAHPEMPAAQEEMVNPDHKDLQAHLVHLVPTATLVLLVLLERLANWAPAPKALLDQLASLAKPVQEANLARLANPARMELQATVAPLEMLVPLADPAKPVHLVLAESQARTAHLAAANTAHQLVWLQVIKRQRNPSQVMRPTRRQLGRIVDENGFHIVPNLYYPAAFQLFDSLAFSYFSL